MNKLADWCDHRTGCRSLANAWWNQKLVRGASILRATGPLVLGLLLLQVLTGIGMMLTYTPSAKDAWASLVYLERDPIGQFVRGLHFWVAQAVVVAAFVHVARLFLMAEFRKPRELDWALNVSLALLILGMGISGNPLSWSQKAQGQVIVEGNIIASAPVMGQDIKQVLFGSAIPGNLTVVRLNALHTAVLPLLLGIVLVLRAILAVRHGPAAADETDDPVEGPPCYWPDQTLRNLLVIAIVGAGLAFVAYRFGAPLPPPADATLPDEPRPEWYMLSVFELRRYFPADQEVVATQILPGIAVVFLLLTPWWDRILPRSVSVGFRFLLFAGAMGGVGFLTYQTAARDAGNERFQEVMRTWEVAGERAREHALAYGIPPEGPHVLVRRDPVIQGPVLFAEQCASCHGYAAQFPMPTEESESVGADLQGFGSEDWIYQLLKLEEEDLDRFWGLSTHHTEMRDWSLDTLPGILEDLGDEGPEKLRLVARWLASGPKAGEQPTEEFAEAYELAEGTFGCFDCHAFGADYDSGYAPELEGYASLAWTKRMIVEPSAIYKDVECKMPAFAETLQPVQTELLARWLLGNDELAMPLTEGSGPVDATKVAATGEAEE